MQSIHLHGAEDVSRAASSMRSAADEMSRAASSINHALEQHQYFLNDWLSRLDGVLTDRAADIANSVRG